MDLTFVAVIGGAAVTAANAVYQLLRWQTRKLEAQPVSRPTPDAKSEDDRRTGSVSGDSPLDATHLGNVVEGGAARVMHFGPAEPIRGLPSGVNVKVRMVTDLGESGRFKTSHLKAE